MQCINETINKLVLNNNKLRQFFYLMKYEHYWLHYKENNYFVNIQYKTSLKKIDTTLKNKLHPPGKWFYKMRAGVIMTISFTGNEYWIYLPTIETRVNVYLYLLKLYISLCMLLLYYSVCTSVTKRLHFIQIYFPV